MVPRGDRHRPRASYSEVGGDGVVGDAEFQFPVVATVVPAVPGWATVTESQGRRVPPAASTASSRPCFPLPPLSRLCPPTLSSPLAGACTEPTQHLSQDRAGE